jgi:vacuolar-type H+-ATPase subunit H
MEFLALIDVLEEMVENAARVPFSNKCMLDRDDLLDIIRELRERLPEDIKQAKWITEERQKILADAQRDANYILKEAENRFQELVDEHEITKRANAQASEIIENTKKKAREIRLGTREYVDSILADLERSLAEKLKTIQEDRRSLR